MKRNKIIIFIGLLSLLICFNNSFAQDEETVPVPKEVQNLLNKDPDNLNPNDLKSIIPLSVTLDYQPQPVQATDQVKVSTQILSSTNSNNITYRWFLDGKERNDKTPTFEFNMNENLVRQDLRCGDFREVKVEVTNQSTKEKTASTIKIPIGLDLSFGKKAIGLADLNNPQSSDFNLHASNVAVQSILLNSPDIFLQTIASPNQFRYGDIIEVSADGLKNTYNNKACTETANFTSYDSFLESLSYKWTFNGTEQETKSGHGKRFSQADFVINTPASRTVQNDTTSCGLTNIPSHNIVGLTISNSEGKILAQKEEPIDVVLPKINLKPICQAYGKNIQCLNRNSTDIRASGNISQSYQVTSGQDITLQANLGNFQPSQQLDIIWKANDQIIEEKTINNPNTPYLSSPVIRMGNENIIIQLDVKNHPYSSSSQSDIEQASQKILITPNQERATNVNLSLATSGSLKNLIPKNFKSLYNFIAAAGVLGIIILLITIKEKKKNG